MEQRVVTANGVQFSYFESGPAEGPLALCLHGFPDTAYTWRFLLPELAAAGFHAVAPFLRGYAPTAIPSDGRYQIGALARDANSLHAALGGTDDAVIIGHDWGALTAYAAVAHQPDRWRRAVTAAVPPTASHRHVALHLCPAAAELVHVLLPLPHGRDRAAPRRLRLHRPASGPTGHRDTRRASTSPASRSPSATPSTLPLPSATTGPSTTPHSKIPSWPTSRTPPWPPRPSRRSTCTVATTDACCSAPSATPSTSWPRDRRWW